MKKLKTKKLKPCPFCGKEISVIKIENKSDWFHTPHVKISCKCGRAKIQLDVKTENRIMMEVMELLVDKVVEQWNERS